MKATALTVTLALAASCAHPPARTAARPSDPGAFVPPARGEFARGASDRVVRSAVALLRAQGHRIAACDVTRVETAPREFDVPCGASRCLGRESVVIRVGHYRARVEVSRVVWNGATRAWDPWLGVAGVEDAAAQEQRLLQGILAFPPAALTGAPGCAAELRTAEAGDTPPRPALWAERLDG